MLSHSFAVQSTQICAWTLLIEKKGESSKVGEKYMHWKGKDRKSSHFRCTRHSGGRCLISALLRHLRSTFPAPTPWFQFWSLNERPTRKIMQEGDWYLLKKYSGVILYIQWHAYVWKLVLFLSRGWIQKVLYLTKMSSPPKKSDVFFGQILEESSNLYSICDNGYHYILWDID